MRQLPLVNDLELREVVAELERQFFDEDLQREDNVQSGTTSVNITTAGEKVLVSASANTTGTITLERTGTTLVTATASGLFTYSYVDTENAGGNNTYAITSTGTLSEANIYCQAFK